MKIDIYILGLLINHGAQHGYRLRQLVVKDISDFANIKTPTIYYHLNKLEKKSYVNLKSEEGVNKIEKKVYSVSAKGEEYFFKNLYEVWNGEYKSEFSIDGAFYFFKHFTNKEFILSMKKYLEKVEGIYFKSKKSAEHVLSFLDKKEFEMNEMIYYHHRLHYEAEIRWIKYVIEKLGTGDIDG